MADCLGLLRQNPTDYGFTAVDPAVTKIIGVSPGLAIYALDTADYTTITLLSDRSVAGAAMVGGPAVDSSSVIWWIETANFSTYQLMKMNLDGTGVTTVVSSITFPSPSMASSFESPNLAYDAGNDVFWFTTSPGGGTLRKISKTGTVTNVFSPPSNSWQFHNPILDASGNLWHRWSGLIYRTNPATGTTSTGSTSFGTSFPAVSLDTSGNGIVENASSTPGNDVYYSWTGSTINAVTSTCDVTAHAFGFTPVFWTPDHSGIFFYEPGSSSPVVDTYLWGLVSAVAEVPPLRLYARDDAKSVAGARQRYGSASILVTSHIRQGSGYL